MIRIVLAIDPGDKHVGYAFSVISDRIVDRMVATGEIDNEDFLDWLDRSLKDWEQWNVEVVVESYVLYPGQDRKNVWNPMRTSELIGAVKLRCSQAGVPVTEQGAHIKKPMRNQLRARKIKQQGKGPHARDAELHLYYRVLRKEKEAPDGEAS